MSICCALVLTSLYAGGGSWVGESGLKAVAFLQLYGVLPPILLYKLDLAKVGVSRDNRANPSNSQPSLAQHHMQMQIGHSSPIHHAWTVAAGASSQHKLSLKQVCLSPCCVRHYVMISYPLHPQTTVATPLLHPLVLPDCACICNLVHMHERTPMYAQVEVGCTGPAAWTPLSRMQRR